MPNPLHHIVEPIYYFIFVMIGKVQQVVLFIYSHKQVCLQAATQPCSCFLFIPNLTLSMHSPNLKVTHNTCSLHLATHFQNETSHMGMFYMVTRLVRRHLLFGLQLHGFEPCKRHLRKMDIGMAPCIEGAPISPKQDVSGRPAHES